MQHCRSKQCRKHLRRHPYREKELQEPRAPEQCSYFQVQAALSTASSSSALSSFFSSAPRAAASCAQEEEKKSSPLSAPSPSPLLRLLLFLLPQLEKETGGAAIDAVIALETRITKQRSRGSHVTPRRPGSSRTPGRILVCRGFGPREAQCCSRPASSLGPSTR